jgi:hypothetical protein
MVELQCGPFWGGMPFARPIGSLRPVRLNSQSLLKVLGFRDQQFGDFRRATIHCLSYQAFHDATDYNELGDWVKIEK